MGSGAFLHGTKADLSVGDLLVGRGRVYVVEPEGRTRQGRGVIYD
jgi:hypothetical protein